MLSCCVFDLSVGVGAFVIRLSHISSFFSVNREVPCQFLDGHVKNPYEMSMALGARP